MKTILATTDFSKASENAVDYAAELAKLTHAKLIIFHSYTMPVPVAEVPIVTLPFEELEKENTASLKAFDKKLKAKHPHLETELITKPGFVVDEIATLVEQKHVDLVIMGLTGAGGAASLLGSNTTTVMKKIQQPVLAIPGNIKFKKPAKIALACDYKTIIPDDVMSKFKKFVTLFGSKVLVFDVLKKAELISYEKATSEVNLENSLDKIEHSLHFPSGDDLPQEVNEFVEKNKVDILTVMPHNYNFLFGLFHHSSAKKIALTTHVPILSIHE
jgi:nucleotide-binding universal stress UspA family protein